MGILDRILGREVKSVSDEGYAPSEWHELAGTDPKGFATYNSQISAGYADNPYVMRCIDLLGNAIASLDPIAYDSEGNEVQVPQLRRLFHRPNPLESWREFAYERVADINLNGNLFALPIVTIRGVDEVWGIPPNHVDAEETSDLMHPVRMWRISNGTGVILVDPSRMIHAHKKLSVDSIMGISPLSAAARSITQQTESRKWNLSLMRNGAKPSLVIQNPNPMGQAQFRDFVARLNASHTGSKAGSTMVLTDGMTISTAGFNARDMDYSQGVTTSGREIAIALGVPPELVGDSANKTYANAQEANREFALHTVVPQADRFFGALSMRICPHYPDVAYIGYDRSQIDGLRGDEATMLTALESCSFLTVNEKRQRLGFEPVPDGDVILTAMGNVPLEEVATPAEDLFPTVDPLDEGTLR